MSTTRSPVGAIAIVSDHPARPYEISVADQFAVTWHHKVAVRASDIVTASELFAALVDFEYLRLAGKNAPRGAAAASWRKLIRRYQAALRYADGDLGEVRIEIDGRILHPAGCWSAARPHTLQFHPGDCPVRASTASRPSPMVKFLAECESRPGFFEESLRRAQGEMARCRTVEQGAGR